MDLLFFVTSGIFFVTILHEILYWTGIWQERDYTLKRITIFSLRTKEGRKKIFSLLSFLKTLGIFFYVYTVFNEQYLFLFQMYVFSIFLLHFFFISVDYFSRKIIAPILTTRSFFICFGSGVLVVLLFIFPVIEKFLWLIVIDRLLLTVVSFFVFFSSFPTELYRDYYIAKAMQRLKILRSRRDMLVIAITGSINKSTTKEYMRQMLAKDFSVVINPIKHATEIGIAKTILHGVDDTTDIFIVDMETYKKGDILQMTHMLDPDIGVITGFNAQYLSLFKTMDRLIAAKLEFIERIGRRSVIIANRDTVYGIKHITKTQKRKVYYTLTNKKNETSKNLVPCIDIEEKKDKTSFSILYAGKKEAYETSLLGRQQLVSLLPAMYIARRLGITHAALRKRVKSLVPLQHTMTKKVTDDGIIILDNTMHTTVENTTGVLDYVKLYKKKKILVFQPIEELGSLSKKIHEELGIQIGNTCDVVLLTNKNSYRQIRKGIKKSGNKCLIVTGSMKQLIAFLKRAQEPKDILAFVGTESSYIMQKML